MPDAYVRKERLMQRTAEKKLVEALGLLKSLGVTFRRQSAKRSPVVDFISDEAKLLIEIDTNQEPDERQGRYNETRAQLLEQRGYKFLRFWSKDVERNLAQIMAQVMGVLRDQHERIEAAKSAAATAKAEAAAAPPPQQSSSSGTDGDLPPPRRKAAGL